MKHTARIAGGKLEALVDSEKWIPELERSATETSGPELETRDLDGVRVVLKRSHLRGSAARRHGLRRIVGLRAPRLAEFENLTWLRARLFHAPKPLFAGVVSKFGVPSFQLLATEFMPQCRTLVEWLAEETQRETVLATLAREIARMHSLGFVHRDLYPRNVLVREANVAFLDAWRGGPEFNWRGPYYDLACLMLYGADWFTSAEQERFFSDYFRERAVQDRAVKIPARFAALIEINRKVLRDRLAKRPHERRDRELPSADWRVPFLG